MSVWIFWFTLKIFLWKKYTRKACMFNFLLEKIIHQWPTTGQITSLIQEDEWLWYSWELRLVGWMALIQLRVETS